jgi:hypothetical protein
MDAAFQLLKQEHEKAMTTLQREREDFEREKKEFEDEKKRMQSITREDDIISLNVGGEKMSCKRSTLCQIQNSLLSSMFNGRWEDKLERDAKGNIFLDWNPYFFRKILNYLRAKRIESPDRPAPFPVVNKDQEEDFSNFLSYLGIQDIIPKCGEIEESFEECFNNISIQEDGKVATHNYTINHGYVLGKNEYSEGTYKFTLKIEHMYNNHWMYVGIIQSETPMNDNSYNLVSSYGWAKNTAQVYINGYCNSGYKNYAGNFVQGDTVHLILNCRSKCLTFSIPNEEKYTLSLLQDGPWRLHINLYGKNDKIRILKVERLS